jgi:hypothetical protein
MRGVSKDDYERRDRNPSRHAEDGAHLRDDSLKCRTAQVPASALRAPRRDVPA